MGLFELLMGELRARGRPDYPQNKRISLYWQAIAGALTLIREGE
jgi:hypothetical protein